jgi:rhomboid family GlyGly-CTERM serine protease
MNVQYSKTILSQLKITLLSVPVLCFFNAGFILGDPQAPWFQALCDFMEFDRAALLRGEIWRLFTGHLVHWSPEHFYLDALVFVAQGIVFEPKIGRGYAQVLGIAGGAIGLTLLVLQSDLAAYRGISGLINTQLVLGTGLFVFDSSLRRSIKAFYMAALGVHMLKIAYETLFKVPFFVTDALGDMGLFTPLAHLGGVMVGLSYLFGFDTGGRQGPCAA